MMDESTMVDVERILGVHRCVHKELDHPLGLGLMMVLRVIRRLSGKCLAKREPGKSTRRGFKKTASGKVGLHVSSRRETRCC